MHTESETNWRCHRGTHSNKAALTVTTKLIGLAFDVLFGLLLPVSFYL